MAQSELAALGVGGVVEGAGIETKMTSFVSFGECAKLKYSLLFRKSPKKGSKV